MILDKLHFNWLREFHLDLLSNKEFALNGGKVPRVLFGNFTKFLASKHVFFVIYYNIYKSNIIKLFQTLY